MKKRDKGEEFVRVALHRGSLVQAMGELERMRKEGRRLARCIAEIEDKTECTACKKRPALTVFSPCGHTFCSEQGCFSCEATECPQCSTPITSRIRLGGPWHSVSHPRRTTPRPAPTPALSSP